MLVAAVFGHVFLQFCYVSPKAFGHELAAQLGVVARFYGDGAVEPLPSLLHGAFICASIGQVQQVGFDQVPFAAFVYACHVVRFVVDDECLRIESCAEPIHKKGDNVCFGAAAGKP